MSDKHDITASIYSSEESTDEISSNMTDKNDKPLIKTTTIEDLLIKIGLSDDDLDKVMQIEEIWESKANREAIEKKEESLSILHQLGISNEDSNRLLDELEVWEVKSDKELSSIRQEIKDVRLKLGITEETPIEYEEVWEKKAETEKVNGWNKSNKHVNTSQTIYKWMDQFTKLVSETRIF